MSRASDRGFVARAYTHTCLALLALFGAPAALAQDAFVLRADELELRSAEQVYLARGNVEIEQEGRLLTADRVFFNEVTRLGVATGNVRITEDGDTLESSFLQFDVDSLRGTVFEGELVAANAAYTMTGTEIQKTGDKTYVVDDARFTTCDCPAESDTDPWAMRSSKADLELDGYAVAKNNRFDVLDVPVMWLPWFFYPLKDKRTAGFLVPELRRSSRAGFSVNTPFFVPVRDNINLTLLPEYQVKRGFKPAAEVEYVTGERSYGDLYGMFIHDRDLDPEDRPDEDFDKDRWGATSEQLHDLPAGLRLHVDTALTSDNNVPFDYDDFSEYRLERYLYSRGFLAANFGPNKRLSGNAGVELADDLQSPDRDDRDDFMLQRLPELELNALSGGVPWVPGLVAGGSLEYVYFQPYRDPKNLFAGSLRVDDQFYDTGIDAIPTGKERDSEGDRVPFDINRDDFVTEVDGVFQEGEPLADSGHRIFVNPRLAYPLHHDYVHFEPEVAYHGTFYETDRNGTDARHLLTARADLRTQFSRTIGWPFLGGKAEHLLEPFVSYALVTNTGQNDNPLFVPQTSVPQTRLRHVETENLVRDGADRIEEVNSVFFGVQNRFLDPKTRREVSEVAVSAEYSAEDTEFPSIVIQGDATPGAGLNTRFHAVYDPEDTQISEGLFHFSWNSTKGHSFLLRYRYVRQIPQVFEDFLFDNDRFDDFENDFKRINQVLGGFYLKATDNWALSYTGNYSFENALSLRNVAGVEYHSRCKCWAIRFEGSHQRQRGFDFGVQYTLLGLGETKQRPFAGAGGNPFARR